MEKNEELENLRTLRRNWVNKRDQFRLKESTTSDPVTLISIEEEIKKCISKISELDTEISIIAEENEIKNQIQTEYNDTKEDIMNAIEALKIETSNLGYNSTKENIERIHALKSKIYNELFDDLNKELSFISGRKDLMLSSVLFDVIYRSETLDDVTIVEIRQLRENTENYKWFDRSVIVTSLSLSLLNFKFDSVKANLLLDFLTDFEDGVYERALVGLVLSIITQNNRSWMRSTQFTDRLKNLQNQSKIQSSLKTIDFILQNETYKYTIITPVIFKLDLFKNPMNYFVPFYENNEIFVNAIENCPIDFEIDEFKEYLVKMPFLDSHRYALCIGLQEKALGKRKLSESELGKLYDCFILTKRFHPYQAIISEYFCFFTHFENILNKEIFQKQIDIINTDLKKYVLDTKMKLLIEGNSLFTIKKYKLASFKYADVLKLEINNEEAKWKLACCYQEIDEDEKAINLFKEIEKVDKNNPNNESLYLKLATSLTAKKRFSESTEYCFKFEKSKDKLPFDILCLLAENYTNLKDNLSAYKFCVSAKKKAISAGDFAITATLFRELEKFDDGLLSIEKAIEMSPLTDDYFRIKSDLLSNKFEWNEALEAINIAIEINPKSKINQLDLARVYLFSNMNKIDSSALILKKLIRDKNSYADVAFGNLGHIALIKNQKDDAFDLYFKCLNIIQDTDEFAIKMNFDKKFITALGIDLIAYDEIKNKVIEVFTH